MKKTVIKITRENINTSVQNNISVNTIWLKYEDCWILIDISSNLKITFSEWIAKVLSSWSNDWDFDIKIEEEFNICDECGLYRVREVEISLKKNRKALPPITEFENGHFGEETSIEDIVKQWKLYGVDVDVQMLN